METKFPAGHMETKTYRMDNLFRLSKVEYLLQSMLPGGSTPLTGGSLRAGFIKQAKAAFGAQCPSPITSVGATSWVAARQRLSTRGSAT